MFVSNATWTAKGDGLVEVVDLPYGAVKVSYSRTDPRGAPAPPLTGQWNQVANNATYPTP